MLWIYWPLPPPPTLPPPSRFSSAFQNSSRGVEPKPDAGRPYDTRGSMRLSVTDPIAGILRSSKLELVRPLATNDIGDVSVLARSEASATGCPRWGRLGPGTCLGARTGRLPAFPVPRGPHNHSTSSHWQPPRMETVKKPRGNVRLPGTFLRPGKNPGPVTGKVWGPGRPDHRMVFLPARPKRPSTG